jgi:hypothetical protein
LADLKPGANKIRLEAPASGLDPETRPETLTLDLVVDRWVRTSPASKGEHTVARGVRAASSPSTPAVRVPGFRRRSTSAGEERDDPDDEYVIRHDGRVLVLDQEVREQALLARPMTSLCREDCPGLCPRCGADRAEGNCRCDEKSQAAH